MSKMNFPESESPSGFSMNPSYFYDMTIIDAVPNQLTMYGNVFMLRLAAIRGLGK